MNENNNQISNDLPREKLLRLGAESLKDEELLAILFGSGVKGCDVFALAKEVLKVIDQKNNTLGVSELKNIYGVGLSKASQVVAALEFARRRIRPEGIKVKVPGDVLPLLQHLQTRKQECFVTISLNGAHEVIESRIVTVGLLNFCQVHPREVLADVIVDRAAAIIIAHNHPSGSLEPSDADHQITKRLADASKLLGIELLDHIIISSRGFVSFKERGWL